MVVDKSHLHHKHLADKTIANAYLKLWYLTQQKGGGYITPEAITDIATLICTPSFGMLS